MPVSVEEIARRSIARNCCPADVVTAQERPFLLNNSLAVWEAVWRLQARGVKIRAEKEKKLEPVDVLDSIEQDLEDADDADSSSDVCPACGGSGEGPDGDLCPVCDGSGKKIDDDEDEEDDHETPDDDDEDLIDLD